MNEAERRKYAKIALKQRGKKHAPVCPFKASGEACDKTGGVCSFRLYRADKQVASKKWSALPVALPDGDLRVMCPTRFEQAGTIYRTIGLTILGTAAPEVACEVRFLRRESHISPTEAAAELEDGAEEGQEREGVGNIDNVLVATGTSPLRWCALEAQAVYFSGRAASLLFKHIRDFPTSDLPFPDLVRRPDYRSSGPKRLMPQLQIKVPTLRRWGKRMAVVVDKAFYRNMGRMDTVGDLSNCDIAWFLIAFDESTDPSTLHIEGPAMQTLERAVEGLTGGSPVTLSEFEAKVVDKLAPKPKRRRGEKAS